jgi:hypothetical protein
MANFFVNVHIMSFNNLALPFAASQTERVEMPAQPIHHHL